MRFTQHIVFYAENEEDVVNLASEGSSDRPPGLLGVRVLRFRHKPGRYVIQAEFESHEAAEASNERPQTRAWAERLNAIATSEIKWENLDVVSEG